MQKKNSAAQRVAVFGLLGALSCALSFLESLLPPIAGLPPGAKPGLANVAVMAAGGFGLGGSVLVALIKACFALLTRGATAGWMSLCGGVLSALCAGLLLQWGKNPFGYLGVGILGALSHNLGQLFAAGFLLGTGAIFGYAPLLLFFGLLTGAVTGTVLRVTLPILQKECNRFFT